MTSNTDKPNKGTNPLFDSENKSDGDEAFIFRDDMTDEDLAELLNSPASVGVSSRKPVNNETKDNQAKTDEEFNVNASTDAAAPSKKMADLLASVRESQNYHPEEPESGNKSTVGSLGGRLEKTATDDFEFSLADELELPTDNSDVIENQPMVKSTSEVKTHLNQPKNSSAKAAETPLDQDNATAYEFSFTEGDGKDSTADNLTKSVTNDHDMATANPLADKSQSQEILQSDATSEQKADAIVLTSDSEVSVSSTTSDSVAGIASITAGAVKKDDIKPLPDTKTAIKKQTNVPATKTVSQATGLGGAAVQEKVGASAPTKGNKQQLDREKLQAIFGGKDGNLTVSTPQRQANTVNRKNVTRQPSSTLKASTGAINMTDDTKIRQVQAEISELKGKLHAMGSDFFNAATDSGNLIGQLRDLQASTGGDFPETYDQGRKLRATLVEARKNFNELASIVDFLEEALEDNLYSLEVKN